MPTFAQAVAENQRFVKKLSVPELEQILPTLYDIRAGSARALLKMLKDSSEDSTYTLHKHRALLRQLDETIEYAEKELPKSLLDQLRSGISDFGPKSIRNLESMIVAGEKQFRGAVSSLKLPHASILSKFEKSVMSRYANSAARYGGDVAKVVTRDLTLGMVRGESVGQIARRMIGGDAKYQLAKSRGLGAVASGMASKPFFAGYYDAERLVRTEYNSVYNEIQVASLRSADEGDPGWMKRWDAANDKRVCDDCDDLDGEVRGIDEDFLPGVKQPPLHPNDRCSVTPWRAEWAAKKSDQEAA